jgi:hypothetical protein
MRVTAERYVVRPLRTPPSFFLFGAEMLGVGALNMRLADAAGVVLNLVFG